MNVYLKHFNFQYVHNRNVLNASLFNESDDTLIKGGRLAELLQECKTKGHNITNAQDVLYEVVNIRGYSA